MEKPLSRQEFFQSVVRNGFIMGLAGVAVAAVKGERDVSECFNHNYCDECLAFGGCTLPEKKELSDEQYRTI